MRRPRPYEPSAADWPEVTPDDWPVPGDRVLVLKGCAASSTAIVLHSRRSAACDLLPDARVLMVQIKPGRWVKMSAFPESGMLEKMG